MPGGAEKVRQIGARVEERMSEAPRVPMKRQTVRVGEKKLKGTAVGPIPGSAPSWEVYVPVDGRMYQVNVYGEKLGAEGRKLLSSLRFDPPSRSASSSSMGLPDGEKAASFYPRGRVTGPAAAEREARREAAAVGSPGAGGTASGATTATRSTLGAEQPIAEGCWRADGSYFFQTQHGWGANARANDDYPDSLRVNIPTGHTIVGMPNFWGSYSHGNLGYGRCTSPYYTNDYYAIDYPLNVGDYVFSPFKSGTGTFAGSNTTHKDYGIFVIIKADNGKYVSMSGHLSALAYGIKKGATVTADTVDRLRRGDVLRQHRPRLPAPAPGLLPLPELQRGRLALRRRGAAGSVPPLRRHGGGHGAGASTSSAGRRLLPSSRRGPSSATERGVGEDRRSDAGWRSSPSDRRSTGPAPQKHASWTPHRCRGRAPGVGRRGARRPQPSSES